MTVVLNGFDVRELFTHALLWGAAAIAEDAGVPAVRVGWTGSGMSPTPQLVGDDLDEQRLAAIVRDHAAAHCAAESWIAAALPSEQKRGLFSPRVGALGADAAAWRLLHDTREAALDRLPGATLDLRLIGALGEPAYWGRIVNKRVAEEQGASRLEMQPRNQGSEFVGSRLRPLASIVARRMVTEIAAGLAGRAVRDEMGRDRPDSRTATNLRPLGATDDAAAWVALWGLSTAPVAHLARRMTRTATHVPAASGAGSFRVPVWRGWWTPARLRTVLASKALVSGTGEEQVDATSREWLVQHGVRGLVEMNVNVSGSNSAPERRAVTGTPVRIATT